MTVEPEPVYDFIILGVPDSFDLDEPGMKEKLDHMADRSIVKQYKKQRPKALLMLETAWYVTQDWEEVERTQPAHDCITCRAGNDQAIAFLKEFPDRKLAIGNLKYLEVW